ncbi:hypothetical protein MKK75_07565 [Methylobacterium sp. J-030]|uniref:hypothetical protein n=1 Tax=Methylobacterium sp. J-030 TaxID=2836627 RepID=UPI001FB8F0ED|nr:hypothetical protein [Methylobacterium sp. J-030]MCJ2068659.1 hypothetical protein [Methylobacterium sp. J-030]
MKHPAIQTTARRVASRGLGLFAIIALMVVPDRSHAQGQSTSEPRHLAAPSPVPTTKVLAIGSFTETAKTADWQRILPDEVRATVLVYLDGKIDQWFVKQDQSGVVFLMNVSDVNQAKIILEKLPFGRAKLMDFRLIPLGPVSPLRVLLGDQIK